MRRFVLDPHVGLSVLATTDGEHERHEELGCGLQGPTSRAVRHALGALRTRLHKLGPGAAIARAEELVRWLDDRPELRALARGRKRHEGRLVLRDEVLYPDPSAHGPRTLHVRHGLSAFELDLPPDVWPAVSDAFAALAAGDLGSLQLAARVPEVRELLDELAGAGWITERAPLRQAVPDKTAGELLFVGHNTVIVAGRRARVLVDPWLRPWHPGDPDRYKPLAPAQLGPLDAVLITHSHGDHFHLGSLLHLPRDTPILVPYLPRESVLSVDLAFRLGQLGFTAVRQVRWWETARVGDVTVQAMPFYGEQPTAGALVYPELRNAGNTWLVRTPDVSAAFLADSGRDGLGSMLDVALQARRQSGPVDALFTGIRSFRVHPVLYPFSTLDVFLLNVPLELAGVAQKLMSDADDALDVAEAFGARFVVPYADGGAPWYWREGMGPAYRGYPAYEGFRAAAERSVDDPRSDPFPERLSAVARARYGGEGPCTPLVLRPGDRVSLAGRRPRITRPPGHGWPYGEGPDAAGSP